MFRFFKFDALQHPSDETLLGYLDGEIGARRSRRVAAHLDACWACRLRRDRLEQLIHLIMEARPGCNEAVTPPGRWNGFEPRLANERNIFNPFQDLLARWAFVSGLTPRYASLMTTILLAFAAWLYLGSSVAFSASEVLRRAGYAQQSQLLQVDQPVTYQKLALYRRSAKAAEINATAELWRAAGGGQARHTEANELWTEIERVLQTNHMDTSAPLSPASYASWCATGKTRVRTTWLPEGEDAYSVEIQRERSGQVPDVVSVALLIRASDWHPVQATLQVRMTEGFREYRISELAFRVRPLSSLDQFFFSGTGNRSGEPPAPAPARLESAGQPSPRTLAPKRANAAPENLEIEVRYLLHRACACLGESVEVVRKPSGNVVVRGLVQTAERRQELIAVLLPTPVKVEIETADALAEKMLAHTPRGSKLQSYPEVFFPLQQRLEEYFAGRGPRDAVGNEIVDLSNRVVSQSQEILGHAWALRRLELDYAPERAQRLPSPARRLLEQMSREHAEALRATVRDCRLTLVPFFSSLLDVQAVAALAPAKADPSISDLLASAREAESLTGELFAGTTDPRERSEETVELLVRTLAALENATGRVEAALAEGFPGSRVAALK